MVENDQQEKNGPKSRKRLVFHEILFDRGQPIFPKSKKTRTVKEGTADRNSGTEKLLLVNKTSSFKEQEEIELGSTDAYSSSPKKNARSGFSPQQCGRRSPFHRRNVGGYRSYKSPKRSFGYEFRSHKFKTNPPREQRDWLVTIKKFCELEGLICYEQACKVTNTEYGIILPKLINNEMLPPKPTAFSPVRLVCDRKGNYSVEVFFMPKYQGQFVSKEDMSAIVHKYINPKTCRLVVCRGVVDYELLGTVGYKLKNVREWQEPFKRVDSIKCELLHKPCNRKVKEDSILYNVCSPCKKLHRQINNSLRNKYLNKEKRAKISSRCNWRYLSPKSKKKRQTGLSKYNKKLKRQLKKIKVSICSLNDTQNCEMNKVVKVIEKDYKAELEDVIEEAGRGEREKMQVLKTVWEQDVKDKKDFLRDQQKNSKSVFM